MPFCRHCGHQYEGAAKFCPECGQPQTDVAAAQAQAPQEPPISQDEPEEVIWEGESKSMANRMSGGKVVSARYRLTNRAIYFREGVVAKTTEQVPLWAVRDIDISEGMLQRRRGVGTIKVFVEHSDYTGKNTVILDDVEEPGRVAQLINQQAQRERLAYQQRQQTKYYGQGR
jgi:Bacterial PH domain/zinc-ribbon domain